MSLAIGDCTSFGKVVIPSPIGWQKVHYLVIKSAGPAKEKGSMAICLEYGQTAWDKHEKHCFIMMCQQTKDYLEKLGSSPYGRKELLELLGQNTMESYWGIYRRLTMLYGDPEADYQKNLERENKKLKVEVQAEIREIAEAIMSVKVDMASMRQKMEELETRDSNFGNRLSYMA